MRLVRSAFESEEKLGARARRTMLEKKWGAVVDYERNRVDEQETKREQSRDAVGLSSCYCGKQGERIPDWDPFIF